MRDNISNQPYAYCL